MTTTKPAHGAPDLRDASAGSGPALRLVATTDTPARDRPPRADFGDEHARVARRQAQAISEYFAADPNAIIWMIRVLT